MSVASLLEPNNLSIFTQNLTALKINNTSGQVINEANHPGQVLTIVSTDPKQVAFQDPQGGLPSTEGLPAGWVLAIENPSTGELKWAQDAQGSIPDPLVLSGPDSVNKFQVLNSGNVPRFTVNTTDDINQLRANDNRVDGTDAPNKFAVYNDADGQNPVLGVSTGANPQVVVNANDLRVKGSPDENKVKVESGEIGRQFRINTFPDSVPIGIPEASAIKVPIYSMIESATPTRDFMGYLCKNGDGQFYLMASNVGGGTSGFYFSGANAQLSSFNGAMTMNGQTKTTIQYAGALGTPNSSLTMSASGLNYVQNEGGTICFETKEPENTFGDQRAKLNLRPSAVPGERGVFELSSKIGLDTTTLDIISADAGTSFQSTKPINIQSTNSETISAGNILQLAGTTSASLNSGTVVNIGSGTTPSVIVNASNALQLTGSTNASLGSGGTLDIGSGTTPTINVNSNQLNITGTDLLNLNTTNVLSLTGTNGVLLSSGTEVNVGNGTTASVNVNSTDVLNLSGTNAVNVTSGDTITIGLPSTAFTFINASDDIAINCAFGSVGIISATQTNFSGAGVPVFSGPVPQCASLPTLANELTNKQYVDDRVGGLSSGILDSPTATGTVIGTDQTLNPQGFLPNAPTIPANYFKAGQSFSLRMSGTGQFFNGDNFNIKLKAIDALANQVTLGSINIQPPNTLGTVWELEAEFTCRQIILPNLATFLCSFDFTYNNSGALVGKRSITSAQLRKDLVENLQAVINYTTGNASSNATTNTFILKKDVDV